MTEFSKAVVNCIAEWSKSSAACNGNTECFEYSARHLRECLDAAFPDSKRIELESNKVKYVLSSVFFLANRLSKATEGLAEFPFASGGGDILGYPLAAGIAGLILTVNPGLARLQIQQLYRILLIKSRSRLVGTLQITASALRQPVLQPQRRRVD